MTQYEGGLLFDMMAIPYEEMSEWYYVIELASLLFPEERRMKRLLICSFPETRGKDKEQKGDGFRDSSQASCHCRL